MIQLVLFDIDGTLISTGGAGTKAFERTAATLFNLPKGTERLNFAGRTDTSIIREFFVSHNLEPSPENFQNFMDCYIFWLDYLIDKLEGGTMSGVWKLIHDLESLPRPPALGLLTGNIRLGAEIKLRYYHLWDHFQIGAFGDDHEERKQLGLIAHQRGRRFLGEALAGEQILVIGDTPLDIECATAITAKMLAVASGGHSLEQLQAHRPTWAVRDLHSIDVNEICA